MAANPEKPPLADNNVALGATSDTASTRAGAAVHPSGTQSPSEHDAIGTDAPDARRSSYKLPVSDAS